MLHGCDDLDMFNRFGVFRSEASMTMDDINLFFHLVHRYPCEDEGDNVTRRLWGRQLGSEVRERLAEDPPRRSFERGGSVNPSQHAIHHGASICVETRSGLVPYVHPAYNSVEWDIPANLIMGRFLTGKILPHLPLAHVVKMMFGCPRVACALRTVRVLAERTEVSDAEIFSVNSFSDEGWARWFITFAEACQRSEFMHPSYFMQPTFIRSGRELIIQWTGILARSLGRSAYGVPHGSEVTDRELASDANLGSDRELGQEESSSEESIDDREGDDAADSDWVGSSIESTSEGGGDDGKKSQQVNFRNVMQCKDGGDKVFEVCKF